MHYPDGTPVAVRDLIWWNKGTCLGYVCEILDDPAELAARELEESGIMIAGIFPVDLSAGFVFYGKSHFANEGIRPLTPIEDSELARATVLARAQSTCGFEKDDLHWAEPHWNEAGQAGWIFHRIAKNLESCIPDEIEDIVIPPGIPALPLNYPDGMPVQNGDLVWWNEGACIGHVQIIAGTENEAYFPPGIFIIPGYPFRGETGGVLHPTEIFEDEGIGLFSPEERTGFDRALEIAATDPSVGPQDVLHDVRPRIESDSTGAWLAGWEVTYRRPDHSRVEVFVPLEISSPP